MDLSRLPFEDGSVDTVVCSRTFSLYWLEDLPPLLSEIGRVLRPGGELWVVELDLQILAHRYIENHTLIGSLNEIIYGGLGRMSVWDTGMVLTALDEVGFKDAMPYTVFEFPFCDFYEDYYSVVKAVRP